MPKAVSGRQSSGMDGQAAPREWTVVCAEGRLSRRGEREDVGPVRGKDCERGKATSARHSITLGFRSGLARYALRRQGSQWLRDKLGSSS